MPGSVPLPFPDALPAAPEPMATADPVEPSTPPVADGPRHRREGLLFEPDAWEEPAAPPPSPGDGA
jgi:hypothetical protein